MLENILQIKDKDFIVNNRKIRLRGFSVGSWMNLEHFMIGMPGADQSIKRTFDEVLGNKVAGKFFNQFLLNFLQEDDFKF